MRSIQIQPLSLLAGAGLALLVVVAMGQNVVPNGQVPPRSELFEQVTRPPALFPIHPRDWVQIEQGSPYVVPTGKILAMTALGRVLNVTGRAYIQVDGVNVMSENGDPNAGNGTSMKLVPRGLAVQAGSTVTVSNTSSGEARAWGYLVDA